MKKKVQRTKLPLLVFEAESWPVDIKHRNATSQHKPMEKALRTGNQKSLRLPRQPRLVAVKSGLWSAIAQATVRASQRAQ